MIASTAETYEPAARLSNIDGKLKLQQTAMDFGDINGYIRQWHDCGPDALMETIDGVAD